MTLGRFLFCSRHCSVPGRSASNCTAALIGLVGTMRLISSIAPYVREPVSLHCTVGAYVPALDYVIDYGDGTPEAALQDFREATIRNSPATSVRFSTLIPPHN